MERLADYRLVEPILGSGYGRTYLATAPPRLATSDEFVVVKVLSGASEETTFARVANELRLLNSISSPFVVRLLDAGSTGGHLFIVTPFYSAGSLQNAAALLEKTAVLRTIRDAARGLHALHEIGVAHRDIKPANILRSHDRGLIAELSLAQFLGGDSTTVGGPLGAVEFVAPDIIWGNKASRATDLWSLGMTTFRALTGTSALGRLPATSLLDACRHVLHAEPDTRDLANPELEEMINRCFSSDPDYRYPTAEHFAASLEQLLVGAI